MANPPFEIFSTTCANSSIEFSELPPVDKSFAANFTEVVPCGLQLPVDVSDTVTLKFLLGESKLWIDPLQTALKLKFQAVNADGKPLKEDKKIATICGLLYTAFNKLQIWSAGRVIKTYYNYPYLAHPLMLLHFDRGYTETVLSSSSAFYMDTFPANDLSFVANQGLDSRRTLVQRSKIFELMAHPFIPPFETTKLIPSHGRWELHYTMKANDFCMLSGMRTPVTVGMGDEPEPKYKLEKFKLILLEAEMQVTRVELSDEAKANLQYMLQNEHRITYPFVDYQIDSISLATGQKEQRIPNTPLSGLPRRVYLFMVKEDAVNGNQEECPFWYKNYQLTQVTLTIGGKQRTLHSLEWNNNICAEAYNGLVRALNISNRSLNVNGSNHRDLNSIIAFDTTPSGNSAMCDQISTPIGQTSTYSISLNFKVSLTEQAQLFVIMEYENIMTIDEFGSASIL